MLQRAWPQLIFVTGKGGVGKTTVAAALASALAARGRRVLAVEIGVFSPLGHLLLGEAAGYAPRPAWEGVDVCRLTSEECLREYGLMRLKVEALYRLIFEGALVRALVKMMPGMEELLLIGKIGYLLQAMARQQRAAPWDTVVVDCPPTGQGAGLLSLPTTVLGAVKRGPVAAEMGRLRALLTDPQRTGVMIVTNAEELAVDEALELEQELVVGEGIPGLAMVVNRRLPPSPPPVVRDGLAELSDSLGEGDGVAAGAQLASLVGAAAALEERELARLGGRSRLPVTQLPLVGEARPGGGGWSALCDGLSSLWEGQ